MKTNVLKEKFEAARNQHNRFGLSLRLTLIVTLELICCTIIALGVDVLLRRLFQGFQIPLLVDLIIVSLLIGFLATSILSRIFFTPARELRKAIEQVADGDFSVRIETKSSSKEIKEIFTGFNLMAHELHMTEILQSDFVSNVSHEFKTPISAIEGYSMLLQNGDNLTDEQQLYIEKIILNTKRLSGLMGSILLLSKLENQTLQSKESEFSLDEKIRLSLLDLEEEWSKKDIEFDASLDSIIYKGQEALLYHVFSNLISNAIKFSPNGGQVYLTLTSNDNAVTFTISDCGIGLSEDEKKHVFDKFYQGDTSHKGDGNGLGLSLVKKIVSLHNGTVTADNRKEGGAIFTVSLPITTNRNDN